MLRRGSVALVVGSLLAVPGAAALAAPVGHHGDALVRIRAAPAEVEALGLDVWSHGVAGPSVVARVTLQQRPLLDVSGLDYVVLDPDLGPRVAAERARLLAAPPASGGLDPGFYDDFHGFEAILARLAAMVASDPERVSHVELGQSLEGRLIRGLRITNPGAGDRPVVVVQGGQHAREWIAVMSTLFVAEQFAAAAEGTALDALLDQVELVVVPVANPDGFVYTWEDDRFWRKNRRDGQGVDTNRNWSLAWGGEGSSGDPASQNYRGAAPFSEPEPVAMRDFVEADPRVIALLDVHSFGELVLYPWGYDPVDSADHELFTALATDIADAMASRYDVPYLPLQSAELYPASGNTIDWAYGTYGIYAVALELRPEEEAEMGFVVPPSSIVPTGEEVLAATIELVETAVELGPGEPGGADLGPFGDDTTGALDGTTDEGGGGSFGGGGPPTTGETGLDPSPTSTGSTGDTDGEADGAAQDAETIDGCGCVAGTGSRGAWWALGALGLALGSRRRRSASARRAHRSETSQPPPQNPHAGPKPLASVPPSSRTSTS